MTIVVLAVLGLCFGSFVNALVFRLHKQSKNPKARNLSIVHGRSICPDCNHELGWQDLLPVISWLGLGGRCRYCKKPISVQYPVVELATVALFVLSYAYFPLDLSKLFALSSLLFVLWLAILVGFVALFVYDLKWMLLPDRVVFPLQALAGAYVLILQLYTKNYQILPGAVLGILCGSGVFYALYHVSKGKWIGGGDVKLAVVLGALLGGPVNTVLMLFIASSMGSIVGIPLLIGGKAERNSKLPFGTFLIVATIIVYLFGASITTWYRHQFLFV